MIRFENRFDSNAYRVANIPLASTVETVEEGQWVTFKGGALTVADGTEKKSWLCIGSKRTGRDQVSGKIIHKVSFLVGAFGLSVSNFDTEGTYTDDVTPLKTKAGGILTPVTGSGSEIIVAYALGKPVNGFLRIFSA